MHSLTRSLALLALAASSLSAQQYSPFRSVSAAASLDDEFYGEPFSDTDSQTFDTAAAGFWDEAATAEATLAGSVTYADSGQQSWVEPASGWFEAEGFAAGGLYSQLNGSMSALSLVQLDFQVASTATVDFSFAASFSDSFGGLSSHDRPGQATAAVRIEDSAGATVYELSFTYDDGFGSGGDLVVLGPGTYRFTARAEVTDETSFQTVYGSMTVASFCVEGYVDGGSPADLTPPAAPTGLTATAGDAVVDLAWNANAEPDLAGYEVRRATAAGGPFQTIATGAGTAYSDLAVVNGTTYFYAVAAFDLSGNVSAPSAAASATPEDPTPPGPSSVHVQSIDVVFVQVKGPKSRAVATVRIVDDLGSPVQGATVQGTFSGDVGGSASATTYASGDAVLQRGITKKPSTATFCVTGVTAALPYEPADDVETCDGI